MLHSSCFSANLVNFVNIDFTFITMEEKTYFMQEMKKILYTAESVHLARGRIDFLEHRVEEISKFNVQYRGTINKMKEMWHEQRLQMEYSLLAARNELELALERMEMLWDKNQQLREEVYDLDKQKQMDAKELDGKSKYIKILEEKLRGFQIVPEYVA